MSVGRRQFLTAIAAGVVIHGLDRFARGDDAAPATKKDAPPPSWFREALAEMKATRSPGVAIVAPEKKESRETLRGELESLLKGADAATRTHLLEAVYVVVDGAHVGAAKGETAVLLDEEGRRVAGAAVVFAPSFFAERIRPLLRDGDRLAKRAKAARTDEIARCVAGLGSDDEKAAERVRWLVERFAAAGPFVIDEAERAAPGVAQTLLRQVVDQAFEARWQDARPLPFGTRWNADGAAALPDPCPGCGMMIRRAHTSDVLELLAQEARTTK